MNQRFKSISAFVMPAVLAAVVSGCAGTPHQESTGELIDDTVITSKVKAELLNDKNVSAMDIKVETFKGRVLLAGYVKSPDERQRAEGIARAVPGVKAVNNKIELK
jgi:osmotically-inducible protein OsmY